MRKSIYSQTCIPPISIPQHKERRQPLASCRAFSRVALGAALAVFGSLMLLPHAALAVQTAATHQAAPPAHKAVHTRPHTRRVHPKVVKVAEEAPVPEVPKAPEPPKWPVNDPPNPASVIWDSKGLSINANNSSLQQILLDVETATGAKIEGMGSDERIFGVYGPGLARDVVTQLLHGSSYNLLMIGDLGKGAPRQIVLSSRGKGETQTASNKTGTNTGDEDTADADAEDQVQPQQQPVPEPVRPAFAPGAPPRSPQQIMQDLMQRQQEMLNQQAQPR